MTSEYVGAIGFVHVPDVELLLDALDNELVSTAAEDQDVFIEGDIVEDGQVVADPLE